MVTIVKFRRFNRLLALISLIALILISVPLITILKNPQQTQAAWYDDSFGYRQRITFTHNADITSDRRISITVDTATLTTDKMQADCDDTRFTDQNGKLLRFRLVSDCDSASTVYDVVFPTIVNGANVAYVYYGNPSASSGQDLYVSDVTSLSPSGGSPAVGTETKGPGPISYWRFDEANGSTTNDYSNGSNNDLALGAYTWKTSGDCVSGGCLMKNPSTGGTLDISVSQSTDDAEEASSGGVMSLTSTDLELVDDSASLGFQMVGLRFNNVTVPQGASATNAYITFYTDETTQTENTNLYIHAQTTDDCATFNSTASNISTRSLSSYIGWINLPQWTVLDEAHSTPDLSTVVSEITGRSGWVNGNDMCFIINGNGHRTARAQNFGSNPPALHVEYGSNYIGLKTYASDTELDPGTDSFTVSGWFKHTSTLTGTDVLLGRLSSGGYKLYTTSAGFCFGIDNDGTSFPSDSACDSAHTYADSRWHHVAAVKSGTSSITLYIDGVLMATDTSITSGSISGSSPTLIFGNDTPTSANNWEGFIDEFKYYNFAKTGDQIKAEFTARGAPKGVAASFDPDLGKTLSTGLVGYWKLDENTGTAANDSSGNVNTGTLTNTPTWTTGQYGPGVYFDTATTNKYITVPSSATLQSYSQLTLSAWVKPGELQTGTTMLQMNGNFRFYTSDAGSRQNTEFTFNCSGDDVGVFTTSADDISISVWHHIAVTWDGSGCTIASIRVYIDGKLAAKHVNSNEGTGTPSLATGGQLIIGNNGTDLTTQQYQGSMDDVRMYNRALSGSEIAALYAFAPGPVGWWKLDENTGSAPADSSGNGANGSFTGTPKWTPGKFGSALSFDGSSQAVTATLGANPGYFNTVETWVYPTSSVASKTVITNLTTNSSSQPVYGSCTGTAISLNTWTHIVATSTDSTHCAIYQNGVLTSSSATTGVTFGISVNIAASSFTGNMDDIRIYNYARTPKQVVEDMNAGHPAPGSPIGSAVGYWKFDEAAGDTCPSAISENDFCDAIGNGRHLSNPGGNAWIDGKFGMAFWSDGANRDATIADANTADAFDFTASEDLSISFWFKSASATNPGSDEYMVSKKDASAGYAVYIQTDGDVLFGIDDDATWDPDVSAGSIGTDFYDAQWHHVAAVRNVASDKLSVYADGILRNVVNDPTTATLANAVALRVGDGDSTNSDGNEFDGAVDELKIFRSALTADEVKLDYNRGSNTVLGALSTHSDGIAASDSASRAFCIPGDTSTCTGPVGYWKLDENSGNTSNDSSGNGNTGTWNGTVGNQWAKGKIGSAGNFNGSDNYVSANAAASINNLSAITVSAWLYPRTLGEEDKGRFVDKAESNGWSFKFNGGGVTQFVVCYNNCTSFAARDSVSGVLPLNSWHHFTATWDGSSSGSNIHLYRNGVEVSYSVTVNGSGARDSDSDSMLLIGNNLSGTRAYNGFIDDVRVYNYVRTQAQISYDYNRGAPGAWYKFDECQGSTAYDNSILGSGAAGGQNGTITIGNTGTNNATGSCTGNSTDAWFNGATGKFSASLDFDGTDDYVDMGDQANLDIADSQDFALEAWINRESFTTDDTIIAKKNDQTTAQGYILYIDDTNDDVNLVVADVTPDQFSVNGRTAITATGWYHIVAVFDDDSATGSTIYVNGLPDKESDSGTIGNIASLANAVGFQIGSESDEQLHFDGKVDNVKFYNYALNATQVKNAYNESSAVRFGPLTGSP